MPAKSPILPAFGRTAVLIGIIYLSLALMLTVLQRQFIYYPERASQDQLEQRAQRIGLEPWRGSDGQFHGWRSAGSGVPAAGIPVLVFHGNAGFALYREYFREALEPRLGPVHLLEYPGYGGREGRPSEGALVEAAEAALADLHAETGKTVILAGESLGTALAGVVAGRHPEKVAGLLLLTPIPDLAEVAAVHYPWLPVRWLMRDRYRGLEGLADHPGPAAFVIAGRDEIVPDRVSRRFYEAYEGRKRLWVQDGAGHNTLDLHPGAGWWDEVATFLRNDSR
ncbi:MAG: alpha/beta hydrolase [Puniceicoccaceae bacterium]|nr:MAG: alpha/beta hydrolase [Puniceicoccaceae bacterium]